MHIVAVIHDPSSRHARIWKSWLESVGFRVDMVYDETSLHAAKSVQYDLVVPLITIGDFVRKDSDRMKALAYFDSKGFKLLTPQDAIAASSDKLKTAETLRDSSLPHPRTSPAEDIDWDEEAQAPLILKPRFGHSGNDIHLAQNKQDFDVHKRPGMLAQEFVEHAECIRIIASPSQILSAYKKIPPKGEIVANIDKGAERLPIVPSEKMKHLTHAAVNALGGGLMGLDLLDSPKGLFVLDANVPFGFDTDDQKLQQELVAFIQNELQ